jgi:hypothetical protein
MIVRSTSEGLRAGIEVCGSLGYICVVVACVHGVGDLVAGWHDSLRMTSFVSLFILVIHMYG